MLQMVYVKAQTCSNLNDPCPPQCCDPEHACWTNPIDPAGSKICTNCESHKGHPCTVGGPRDCCPGSGFICVNTQSNGYQCL